MDNQKNIQTVQQLYADFGAKNLEGVLNSLADDIRWEPPFVPEIPHTKLRNGKKEVTSFVIEMAAEVSYSQLTAQEIYSDKDAVIVKGFFEGKAIHTGKSFESDWIHIWKFRGDKIRSYQAFWNTQRMLSALM
jgi:ketosteroid isomerase-like protein